MGTLQNSITNKRAEIQRLTAEEARIEENYGNKPQFEQLKRNALRPLHERITQLELQAREIEASFEYSQEREIDAMFAASRQEAALEARRQARAERQEAEAAKYDQDIARFDWSLSGISDKPRVWGDTPLVNAEHRAIARAHAAELAARREAHALRNSDSAREIAAELANEHGITFEQVWAGLQKTAKPLEFETSVQGKDGRWFLIVTDASGTWVEADHKRNIGAVVDGGDTGNGGGE